MIDEDHDGFDPNELPSAKCFLPAAPAQVNVS